MEEISFKEYVENMRFKKLLEKTIREDINRHILNGYFYLDEKGNLAWKKQKRGC